MWESDHKQGWAPKNWCFQTVVLEKILESPSDCKEIKSVNRKGNQPWIFTGRTNADAEVLILWPLDVKSRLIRKDPDAGKSWRQENKGATENEMVGWHHWHNGHEFEQTPRDSEGQGSLVCCSPRGCKESDMAEWLSNNLFPNRPKVRIPRAGGMRATSPWDGLDFIPTKYLHTIIDVSRRI